MIAEIWVLTVRDLRRWVKSRFIMVSLLLRPSVWLLLFGSALSTAIAAPATSGGLTQQSSWAGAPDYFNFATPGILALMILLFSVKGASSLIMDRYFGVLDRFKMSPISYETISLSKVLSSVIMGLVQASALLVLATLLGFRISGELWPLKLIGAFATLFLLGLSLSAIFVAISTKIKRWETQEALFTSIQLPLLFSSNALYPINRMPEWLKPFATLNPLSYGIETLRRLFFDSNILSDATLALDFMLLGILTLICLTLVVLTSRFWLE